MGKRRESGRGGKSEIEYKASWKPLPAYLDTYLNPASWYLILNPTPPTLSAFLYT